MCVSWDCLGLRSKKAGKAEKQRSMESREAWKEGKAEQQRSREKQRSKEAGKSRKAYILEKKTSKKQGAEKQRSRETEIQEKNKTEKIIPKINNPP